MTTRPPRPEQILELKVCDPAMGSGAFLVEVCRELGDALVEAWAVHGGRPVAARETRTRGSSPSGWSRSDACTASTATRSPSTSPRCRCG